MFSIKPSANGGEYIAHTYKQTERCRNLGSVLSLIFIYAQHLHRKCNYICIILFIYIFVY